jgi:hypothetical protein
MALTLQEVHRTTEPGMTARWKLVGVLRATVMPVLVILNGTAAGITISEFVRDAGWTDLTQEISKLVGG